MRRFEKRRDSIQSEGKKVETKSGISAKVQSAKQLTGKESNFGEKLTSLPVSGSPNGLNRRPRSCQQSHSNVKDSDLKALPSLVDAPSSEQEDLLLRKLRVCCSICDFSTEEAKETNEALVKRQTLLDIRDYLEKCTFSSSPAAYQMMCQVFALNVFRALPPSSRNPNLLEEDMDEESEQEFLEPAWPHLQIVYEIFLEFLSLPHLEIPTAKRFIDQTFIVHLLDIFDSEDLRERSMAKTILHRIYGKFTHLRQFIRRQISNVFFTFIYETERFNGIAELLEIMGSIINGFQSPLKEEHKVTLQRVLLPLHKVRSISNYHPQLAYCIIQYLEKDPSLLSMIVVDGLLRFWPKTFSSKEVMFLNEMEECLEVADSAEFAKIAKPVSMQLAKCICSMHFQVSERAVYFWSNELLLQKMAENIGVILPIVFPALYSSKQHWNRNVNALIANALKSLSNMDRSLFEDCASQFQRKKQTELERLNSRKQFWEQIESAAETQSRLMAKAYSGVITNADPSGSNNSGHDPRTSTFPSPKYHGTRTQSAEPLLVSSNSSSTSNQRLTASGLKERVIPSPMSRRRKSPLIS
nr:unnamed protein product [Spirometra erinaceieuropaei]